MKRFLDSELPRQTKRIKENAFFHVIPVALEHTVTYGKGTSNGPDAILEASDQLETLDSYTMTYPNKQGIYTHLIKNSDYVDTNEILCSVQARVKTCMQNAQIPVIVGGEHSITYHAIKAAKDLGMDVGVIQIDAHCDLRDEYEGESYSHATVMRRIHELGVPIFQFGTRAYCTEEHEYRSAYNKAFTKDDPELPPIYFCDAKHPNKLESVPDQFDFPEFLYLSIDVDGLDPSIIPSTGTPVPGGLAYYETLDILKFFADKRQIIGMDLMEFAPIKNHHAYDFTAAQLLYSMMGIVSTSTKSE